MVTALHTAKENELLNMDKFGMVEVVDRPQSQHVFLTRWVSKQRLDGSCKVRLVARGFEQTVTSDSDFYVGTPKLTTLRRLLTIAALHGNPVAFWRLSQCISSITDPKCKQNTFSRCMYRRRRFVSSSHMMLHTLAWLKLNCVPKTSFLIPSLVSRHVSRPAQYTQHFVLLFNHFPLLLLLSLAQAQG